MDGVDELHVRSSRMLNRRPDQLSELGISFMGNAAVMRNQAEVRASSVAMLCGRKLGRSISPITWRTSCGSERSA